MSFFISINASVLSPTKDEHAALVSICSPSCGDLRGIPFNNALGSENL